MYYKYVFLLFIGNGVLLFHKDILMVIFSFKGYYRIIINNSNIALLL